MEEEEKARLAARVRAAAREAGLKSHEVAARMGVKAARVRGWWIGRNRVPAHLIPALALALGTEPDALLHDAPGPVIDGIGDYLQAETEPLPLWPRLTVAQRTAVVGLIAVLGDENERLRHG